MTPNQLYRPIFMVPCLVWPSHKTLRVCLGVYKGIE